MKHSELNSRALYFRLMTYVRPYWKVLTTSVVLLALLAITEPVLPALLKPLLDEGFTNHNEEFIQWIPIALVVLFLLRGALGFTSKYASSWVANRVVTDLRQAMFEHTLFLPTRFYDQHSSGRLASHIATNPQQVTVSATMALTVLIRDTLTILALMGWLLWLNWQLTSITLILFPLIILTVRYFNKRLRKVSRSSQHALANITHMIEEAVSNNRVVKIFTAEDFEKTRFQHANEKHRGLAMRTTVAQSAVTPLVQLLSSLSVSMIIAIALQGENHNQVTAGEFVSFLTSLLLLLPPIKRLTDVTSIIQRGLASAEIIFGLLDETREQQQRAILSTDSINGDINFTDIHYAYDDTKKVIDGFNLTIPKGKTYALIGKSGSGKTTITNLLAGLYSLEQGDIQIGDISIHNISLQSLRANIAMVSQDVRLFNDTILNNVAYADPIPDEEKAMNALKAAHALEFITPLPDGIHTQVGQNGITLSGGQRQRIAIARAFYKNASILILDEATSALDTESERYIQEALEELVHGRTSIVIAHRLSTIEHADKIVVMKDGSIIESGCHQELLDKGDFYASYYNLQFNAQEQ
ncbi:MAG: lipid A export permease/ATP-binding protein MsbA [Candidatus Marinimicrobia bacterium]|jgi:ATP-binding cassette, subfamily B, bacterial MsbA|nr:lipid A export permease/ATP-binding protein MsbA [Candidatus Neomarinimicrobiota bacterium]MBT4947398.1 lipid A export permease/ATP-binding protein MsbA [Candidatus Neomarinimicrobiota bacterium]MBT5271466.1 lipid A export permease/ATP-binding protein MsbA [Candidatus Neomarinimicrobiota bacterium]MBT6011736.1 lipid A export permease/ATP-binding protein MsbA [Candidatus Neomarinimicrobiota bacterium]